MKTLFSFPGEIWYSEIWVHKPQNLNFFYRIFLWPVHLPQKQRSQVICKLSCGADRDELCLSFNWKIIVQTVMVLLI